MPNGSKLRCAWIGTDLELVTPCCKRNGPFGSDQGVFNSQIQTTMAILFSPLVEPATSFCPNLSAHAEPISGSQRHCNYQRALSDVANVP